ncbi:MAG: DUF983 domain-containing protein [Acidimicrobiia bacterium]
MTRDPSASTLTMLGRALRRRCPRCGGKAFSSYFRLREHCERCGMRFEREEGYWVGALVINTAVVFGSFLILFVGGIALTWPDVPWGALAAVTTGAMAILPVVFYPFSKTLWMALELSWHPLEEQEITHAAQRARTR